ncbi:MAG: CHAD domain-containing protein [Desulfobulbaceae bacterium]|nr:CHAD domain-containing protein [Desulfobulbaceae bacterium]
MKEQEYDVWYLPHSMEFELLMDELASKFAFEIEQPREESSTYFDTFDWRLHSRGFYLQHSSGKWLLSRCDSHRTAELNNGPRPGRRIFSWDFPTGKFRTLLEPVLDVRALLPLVTLRSSTTPARILNKDAKTIGFLFFESQQVKGSENVLRTVKVQGVRGYDKQQQSIRSFLHAHGVVDQASPRYDFAEGLRSIGRIPGDYSSKISIQLDPNLTSRQAAVLIYKQLVATMLRNEEGIVRDLDSEFLHDFRVAMRRIRSGLTQIKNVLPPDVTDHFKEEFSYVGSITGPTRDLDVYLLHEENYKSRLPPALQVALRTFFKDLAGRRSDEQKKLVGALNAPRYRQIINEWQQYLEGDDDISAANADVPVIELARKIISRRYKKILKDGMVIIPATPDENLHRLRIQGKKLRYSLEFFASLFPEDEINLVIKQLKGLQNNLGEFNDLSVQQDMLHGYLDGLRPGSRKNFMLATAIGGLLTNLYHEQHRVREDFFSIFNRFSSKKNVDLFNKLFN